MRALAVMALAAWICGCASLTPPPASTAQPSNLAAETPAGYISFCFRFSEQCLPHPGERSVVTLTSKTWALLNRVNRTVNRDIWPEEDERHYGRAEYWTIPRDGYGDCDDYAVTKRKALLDAGLPAPALRLAVVMTPKASRHAVLTVATDKGDLVLDNLSDEVLPWNAAGFTWVERQDAVDPMKWVSLQPVSIAAAQDRATAATK